ncbi:MAG: hypothetical protein NTU49_10525 [Gammaproteobacteria bacterium]|nr:hypothetical protein [Gammaproteobacteria bacterium]
MKYSVRTFFALFAVLASTAAFSAINVINKSCENGAISYTECPTDAMGKPAGSCSTVGNNVSEGSSLYVQDANSFSVGNDSCVGYATLRKSNGNGGCVCD